MKYIITESKLNEIIKNYLNSVFDVNNIGWTYGSDDWGNDVDYAVKFYEGDYEDGLDENTIFRWYDEGYWNEQIEELSPSQEYDRKLLKKHINQSPIVEFEDSNISNSLNGYFGDTWKEPFKEWFHDNFNFEVNTIHE